MTEQAPWAASFQVDGNPAGHIALRQIDRKQFALDSTITYIGNQTGLEGKVDQQTIDDIRTVTPQTLPTTDLATVPGPLRWLVDRYGVHTPAALIHDRLIGDGAARPPGMTDPYADRYFRFMLHDLGVRRIRRWLMWAAVALRTRWQAGRLKRILLGLWVVASLAGMTTFVIGCLTGSWVTVAIASLAPLLFAVLWEKQYGAGLVAAYAAPWIGPPTLLAAGGYLLYLTAEWAASRIGSPETAGTEPYRYENF